MTVAEHKSGFEITKDIPYLALTGRYGVSFVMIWEKIDDDEEETVFY